MTCLYCQGHLAKERLYDILESDAQVYMTWWGWGHRCRDCGKISMWPVQLVHRTVSSTAHGDPRQE